MIADIMKFVGIDESMISVDTYHKIDVIESGCIAISEGAFDGRVVSSTLSYSDSMIFEILENVKNTLLQMVQQILSFLNNYYLNNIKVLEKYKEVILDNLDKCDEPIKHETFEYPDSKNYPHVLKTTNGIERDIVQLQKKIQMGGYTNEHQVSSKVDDMITYFSRQVIDEAVDLYDISGSTREIVYRHIRGRPTIITITRATLNDYISQISNYKRDKDDITRTKKSVLEDYELLKRTYANATKPLEIFNQRRGDIASATDPERAEFMDKEYRTYANIHMEMMRLFNSYIKIYQAAFTAKLNELNERIEANRNTINAVMMKTGVFAAINPKQAPKDNRPLPYNPKFVT